MTKFSEIKIITKLHLKTKRNYIKRMTDNKIECMNIAKQFAYKYWDGDRKYGYGGYKYIPGRWEAVARKLIKKFNLTNDSKIIDIGCGKGFLLYEIFKIIPKAKLIGVDISKYALKYSHLKIKKFLKYHDARKKLNYSKKYFDLAISTGCLHNFDIIDLNLSLKEISRISKKQYIVVESYRNNKELFNLQCWALTCESFLSKKEWIWLFNKFSLKGNFELIYFS
jgi:SAM-dependent methyltransferase